MQVRRTLVFCLLAAITSQSGAVFAAPDTSPGVKTKRHHTGAQKSHSARARPSDSCAQFGIGFVRMAGSDTCVQIGGAIDVGGGVGVGR
jgi:hypothetical protein